VPELQLSDDEMTLLRAAVAADERGEEVHDAAIAAVQHLDQAVRMAMVARLHEAGYLQAALLRGGGRLQSAHINRVLAPGFNAVRRLG
jgi:prephenate dehydrogenase